MPAAAVPNQGQPAAGGVGGMLGRLMGMAPQPQLVPGGAPHGFMPPPPGVPQLPPVQGQGQMPGYVQFIHQPPAHPYPPGYPYHYPYYPPPMYPQLPPNAQVLRGFYGPGGVYYPWPAPAEQDPQGAQGAGARETPEQNGVAGGARNAVPTPQVNETPAPITSGEPTNNAPPPPSLSSSNGSSTETNEQGNPNGVGNTTNPREAAALAALRRLNLPRATPQVNGIINRPTAPPPPNATTPPSSTVNPSATPTEPQPPRPTPTAPAVPDVPPASNDPPRLDAPTLIPLYEFSSQTNPLRFPNVGPSQLRPQTYRPQGSSTRPSASATGNAHGENGGLPRTAPYRRTPLHQLPATLTEEQLTRLDGLTREAIDERLRVLENVQGAVFRCVEELTRMRSVLPATALAQMAEGLSGGVNPPSVGASSGPTSTSEAPASQTSDTVNKSSTTGTSSTSGQSRWTFVPNTQEGSSSAEGSTPDFTSTEDSIPGAPLPTPES